MYSSRRMDKYWHIVQLFESFICFIHWSLVSHWKTEGTEYFHDAQVRSSWRLGWYPIRSALSLFKSTVRTTKVLHVVYSLISANRRLKIQMILLYFKYKCQDYAKDWGVLRYYKCYMAVLLIVHKNHTLLATVPCWTPLTEQLFQDHDHLLVKASSPAKYSIVAIVLTRWSIASKAANESIVIVPMNT